MEGDTKLIKKTITTTTKKYNDRGFVIEEKTQVIEKEYAQETQQVFIQDPLYGDWNPSRKPWWMGEPITKPYQMTYKAGNEVLSSEEIDAILNIGQI